MSRAADALEHHRSVSFGTVSHPTRDPTHTVSQRGMVSHAARYPSRHGIPPGTVSAWWLAPLCLLRASGAAAMHVSCGGSAARPPAVAATAHAACCAPVGVAVQPFAALPTAHRYHLQRLGALVHEAAVVAVEVDRTVVADDRLVVSAAPVPPHRAGPVPSDVQLFVLFGQRAQSATCGGPRTGAHGAPCSVKARLRLRGLWRQDRRRVPWDTGKGV